MENYITLEDLKDFEVWKSWRNGGGLELEPIYKEKEILKYLQDGINIDGNPTDGYTIFTIKTQHFKISSLDELSVERFEKAILDFKKREELENELLKHFQSVQNG
jgi:superfamily I DNA and/or RNA helicase